MKLLRSSAAQSGFFSRLAFLAGASFIYLLLTITPSYAEEPAPTEGLTLTSYQITELPAPTTEGLTPDSTILTVPTVDENDYTDNALGSLGGDMVLLNYTGSITSPIIGPVGFGTITDDGIRVTINGTVVIDNWTLHGPTWDEGSYTFTDTNPVPIDVLFYEWGGGAVVQLFWNVNGGYELVPSSAFAPTTSPTVPDDSTNSGDTGDTNSGDNSGSVDNGGSNPGDSGGGDSNDQTPDLPSDGSGDSTEPELPPSPPDNSGNQSDNSSGNSGDSQGNSSDSSQGGTQNQDNTPSLPDYIPSDIPNVPENPQDTPPTSDNQQTDSSTDSTQEQTPTEENSNQTEQPQTDESDETSPESNTQEEQLTPSEEPVPDNQSTETSPEPTTTEEAVDAVLDSFGDSPVPVSALIAAGLSFSDLPPQTPVSVRTDENGNSVVITAEVAASLELLANPSELIGAIFTDPGAALAALGNIGADMSPQEREEATKMVVATVIAAGAAINAVGAAGAARTGGNTGGGTPSGGNGGNSETKGVRRRRYA